MNKRLPASRMTSATNNEQIKNSNKPDALNTIGMTSIIDSKQPSYPMKFGKIRNRKQTQMNMHSQTTQNPQKSCLRIYPDAYKSKVFEDTTSLASQSQRINKHPAYIFNNTKYIPQLKQGQCSYLKHQSSSTIELPREKMSTMNTNNPITMGQDSSRHNSTLANGWKQQRRHRDNGQECSQLLQWDPQLKRNPYSHFPLKKNKSYKQLHFDSMRGNK